NLDVLAISGDGAFVAGSASGREPKAKGILAVWDAATGAPLFQIEDTFRALAFSPDRRLLAGGKADGKVTLWSLPDGKTVETFQVMRLPIYCLAFSPGRERIAVGGAGGTLTTWDWQNKRQISEYLGSSYDTYVVAFSPDGVRLASGGREVVKLWDVATGRPLLSLAGGDHASGLAFTPDARALAVSSTSGRPGHHVRVWRLENGRGIQSFRGLKTAVERVWISPDG